MVANIQLLFQKIYIYHCGAADPKLMILWPDEKSLK